MHVHLRTGLVAAIVALTGCADLAPIPSGTCGNAIIDVGEECDSFADVAGGTCGKPGTATQCRYECSAGAPCPAGYGCGKDFICRKPTGQYQSIHDPIEGTVRMLLPADFDGDHRPTLLTMSDDDALGRRIVTIVDPDPDASGKGAQVPALLFSTSVADLDGDGKEDVVFADPSGVGVFLGNAGHLVSFVSYPSALLESPATLRLMPMDVIPAQPGYEMVGFVNDGKGHGTISRMPDLANGLATLATLPHDVSKLAGPIRWAQLDEGAASPCPEIVVAFTDDTSVNVFSPCKPGPVGTEWNVGGSVAAVALPSSAKVDTGVMVLDLDGDGHLDLLIGAGKSYAAYGSGDGTFHSTPAGGVQGVAGDYTLPAVISENMPLAAADLNGDGLLDYVIPEGIVLSGGAYTLAVENLSKPWDSAVIADFNRDGKLDVIGGASTELNLQFFTGTGTGGFNLTSVPTSGPPANFAVGDFDGDLVNDLAFAVQSVTGDQWVVAFGSPSGAPTDVRVMGRVGSVVQVSAARLPDAGGQAADGIDDLVMVSESAETLDSVVLSLGRGERVMLAPFALRTQALQDQPIAVVAGHFFDNTKATIAAVGLGKDDKLRFWHLDPLTGKVSGGIPLPAFLPAEPALFRYGVHMAAAEIDVTGHDEVVISGVLGAADKSGIVVVRPDATTHSFTVDPVQPVDAVSTLYCPIRLEDIDTDPDGRAEVIYKPDDDSPGRILVFINTGTGFDAAHPIEVDPKEGALAFACVHVDRRCHLHVASETTVYSVDVDVVGRTVKLTPVPGLPGGRAIATGDFDGDGLEDIAIGGDSGTFLFGAVPVLK